MPPVHAQPDQLWDDIREELRRETAPFKFHIWLEPLELAAVRGRSLYIRAPDHIRTSVAERYLPVLRRAAASHFHPQAVVELVNDEWQPDRDGDAPEEKITRVAPGGDLNPKYTFEQFVIGGGNRFAHAAALSVAEMPAQAYNPLFLYGRPGLGKTHLLHAIARYVAQYGSGLRVCYATIEEFTSEFVQAVRTRRTADFKERFRSADVVLIDDVQFLAGRAKTREEFFHTFNALVDSRRQLVLTSDRPPEEIADLEERLIERFRSGLVVEVEPPTLAVRRAILAIRARLDEVEVSEEVLDEIAARVSTSVRALEGALIRVVAHASLRDELATQELAREVLVRLNAISSGPAQKVDVGDIVTATAREFDVEPDALLARDRRAEIAHARHVAMYVAREVAGLSLSEIGRRMGGRNHTTVLHAIQRVNDVLATDGAVQTAVENLRRQLQPISDGRYD